MTVAPQRVMHRRIGFESVRACFEDGGAAACDASPNLSSNCAHVLATVAPALAMHRRICLQIVRACFGDGRAATCDA